MMGKGRGTAAHRLMDLLAQPQRVAGIAANEWDGMLRVARRAKLLSRLGAILEAEPDLLARCPPDVPPMFRAARCYPELIQARAAWELRQVLIATEPLGVELLVLKGAGYMISGLPLARARVFADLDLMVREADLDRVENRLLAAGWTHEKVDAYDQHYYREWMHEIPPLAHPQRRFQIDLHHRIVPRTSRIKLDPALLWEGSTTVAPRLRVLSAPDMVLHCTTHLFHDGVIAGAFRDLLDLHEMLGCFSQRDPQFWDALLARGRELNLERPLFYGLRYSKRFLDTPVPNRVLGIAAGYGPSAQVLALMDQLVSRSLPPSDIGAPSSWVSAWLLYVRSHWLRMPPGLLMKHLLKKAARRVHRSADKAST